MSVRNTFPSPVKANHSISQHDQPVSKSKIAQECHCGWLKAKHNQSSLYICRSGCVIAVASVNMIRIGFVSARTDSYRASRISC